MNSMFANNWFKKNIVAGIAILNFASVSFAQTVAPQFLGFDNSKSTQKREQSEDKRNIQSNEQSKTKVQNSKNYLLSSKDCPITPEYPKPELKNGEAGTVILDLLIGNDGAVLDASTDKSSGFPMLDYATKLAVKSCNFKGIVGKNNSQPLFAKFEYTGIIPNNREANFNESQKPHSEVKKIERTAAVVDVRNCEKPKYPESSLQKGETGTVTLQFLIGTDGEVLESKIEKSSGYALLDTAAQASLSKCKFKPGTVNGIPETSWAKIQYAWKLNLEGVEQKVPNTNQSKSSSTNDAIIVRVNMDNSGFDYDTAIGTTLDQCLSNCQISQICKAFSFNRVKNSCKLKNSSGSFYQNTESISGSKIELKL